MPKEVGDMLNFNDSNDQDRSQGLHGFVVNILLRMALGLAWLIRFSGLDFLPFCWKVRMFFWFKIGIAINTKVTINHQLPQLVIIWCVRQNHTIFLRFSWPVNLPPLSRLFRNWNSVFFYHHCPWKRPATKPLCLGELTCSYLPHRQINPRGHPNCACGTAAPSSCSWNHRSLFWELDLCEGEQEVIFKAFHMTFAFLAPTQITCSKHFTPSHRLMPCIHKQLCLRVDIILFGVPTILKLVMCICKYVYTVCLYMYPCKKWSYIHVGV